MGCCGDGEEVQPASIQSSMTIVVIVVFLFCCAAVAGSVADAKNCSGFGWAVAGFLFGPLAVIGAAGLPDRKLRRTMRLIAEAQGIDVNGSESEKPSMKPSIAAQDLIKKKRGY